MFTLKFDLLFPTIETAKELARKLNAGRIARRKPPPDPREAQRMRSELHAARETVRAQMALSHFRMK